MLHFILDAAEVAPTDSLDTEKVVEAAKETFQALQENPSEVLSDLTDAAVQFGLKLLAAIAIYVIGAWIVKRIVKLMGKMFEKRKTESTLAKFATSLVSITLTVILIIISIGALGIETTSIAALLAAGGMAIGMALSGTVQNFAGGIMILIFKPFKVGDFIEAQGFTGTVSEVSITSTQLITVDNRVVVVPNGALANGNINNFSKKELRRVDWTVSLSYGTDADACIAAIESILKADARIIDGTTPGAADPFVAVSELASSSVDFTVRAWVNAADYWGVFFDFNKNVYTELPKKGFEFPFPQMDVHVKQS